MPNASLDTLRGLQEFDSATLFNAVIESMGASQGGTELEGKGGIPVNYTDSSIKSLLPNLGIAIGYAVTAEVTAMDPDSPKIPWDKYYDAMDEAEGPLIGVIKDVDTRSGRGASLGDGMAATHKFLGCTGIVVDGSVRDIAGIEAVGIPAWGQGLVPGHGVFNLIREGEPVVVGELLINPGDLLACDRDGITKIPREMDPSIVLEKAREIREKEQDYVKVFNRANLTWTDIKSYREEWVREQAKKQ